VPITASEKNKRFSIILGIIVADNMQEITTMLERHQVTNYRSKSEQLFVA
jgi:hypothetical protein